MARVMESKACGACATAKRRCEKQMPNCLRCRQRGIECIYPPTKPTSFVLLGGGDMFPVEQETLSYSTPQLSAYSQVLQTRGAGDARLFFGLDIPGLSSSLVDNQLASSWFTSLETWKVNRIPHVEQYVFCVVDLKRQIKTTQRWLSQWVEKGSNPFIHTRLYRTRFPRCVQDAYTALSCYLHKTASNEHIVFQIIEDRAKQLLAEYNISPADATLENITASPVSLDSLEHIARVQALLVYQILCLYDGDIRLRRLAENHIPVLNSWLEQMVKHASQAICLGGSIISSSHEKTTAGLSLSDIAHADNLLWYSWILAESIRRTWLVASGIQAIYLIQQGRMAPCQGDMMFTSRQGVWEAQSALAWEKLCSEVNVGLIEMAEAEKLFTKVAPEDVNEFAKVVLAITYGVERMERWGIQVQDL